MADDILSLGLDISGFSPEKKRNLQDFIALFERLETYQGRVFSPLSGAGLGQFNAAAQQTNNILSQINSKLSTLNATVSSGTNIINTNTNAVNRNTNANNANASSIAKVGRGLTATLSVFRYAAYILPGVGLAGLLGGFVALIGKTIDKLTDFNYALRENQKIETEANSNLLKQISNYETLYNAKKKLYDLDNNQSQKNVKNLTEIQKSGGLNPVSLSAANVNDAKVGLNEINERVEKRGGIDEIVKRTKRRIEEFNDLQQQLVALDETDNLEKAPRMALMLSKKNSFIDAFGTGVPQALRDAGGKEEILYKSPGLSQQLGTNVGRFKNKSIQELRKQYPKETFTPVVTFSEEQMKAAKESVKAKMDLAKKDIDVNEELYEQFTNKKLDVDKTYAANKKLLQDESRKQFVQEQIDDQETIIAKNKLILKDKSSTRDAIIQSIRDIDDARKKISSANFYNVNANSSSTQADRNIAKNKFDNEFSLINKETISQIQDENEIFYQSDLKANIEIEKDKLDDIAIANERIFQNDKKSLQERLDAYKAYVKAKNDIDYLEEKKDLDVLGLSPAQKEEISSNRAKNVANNSSNSEKVLYDIVYSSEQAKLKAIIDGNILQDQEMKAQHAKELEELNTSFANKTVSYREFLGKKKEINQRYKISEEEQNVTNDVQELKRLHDLLKEQENRRDEFAAKANAEKDPKKKDEFGAEFDAEVLAINDTNKEKLTAQEKLDKDLLDQEKATSEKLLTGQKQLEENKKAIQGAAFKLAKQLVDQDYQNRIDKIQLEKEAQDEQFSSRETALQRSSLNEKNKTAYEIQLAEQKREYDISALKEQKKLKHDQALADKELALSESLINGYQAVTKTLAEYGGTPIGFALALSVGTLAALQTASIALTDIPGYEFGTQGKPHEGGFARIGEGGKLEKVKEPGRAAYFVNEDQIVNLPKGTEVFPMNDTPVFGISSDNSGMEQTMMIVRAINKQKKEIKNIIKPVTKIDMGWEVYKNRIFNG